MCAYLMRALEWLQFDNIICSNLEFDLYHCFAEKASSHVEALEREAALKLAAVVLTEHDSPLARDTAASARDQGNLPASESKMYSFSLKRKSDSNHLVPSRKKPTSELDPVVVKPGKLFLSFCFLFIFI
jgi:hypothetical protein